jgi:hypothetical protein
MTDDTYDDRMREAAVLFERAADALSDVFPLLDDDDPRSRAAVRRNTYLAHITLNKAERRLADLLRLRGDDDDPR